MTLVVSLRVPDGVVLAADSLQTTQGQLTPLLNDLKWKDDKTGKEINIPKLELPPIQIPTSVSSYALKLFPFRKKYGIATFGSAIINERTIYNHIKKIEISTKNDIDSVSKVAELIKDYFVKQLDEHITRQKRKIKENSYLVGFQIAGYESDDDLIGRTIEVIIGNPSKVSTIDNIGCTVSGDSYVVKRLWNIKEGQPINTDANFGAFSLTDAIDYAKFLINTTSNFQRFSNRIPTVGGDIDIALITSYSGFKWIKSKEITKILEN
jgi:hypothetical protein